MLTGVLEHEARTGDQVFHRLGHEHVAGSGLARDPGADADGEPAHLVADLLDLPRVQTCPDVDAERSNGLNDRTRAPDAPSRAVEAREEPVAGRVDLGAAVAREKATDDRVMPFEYVAPRSVSELGRSLGRTDDVGEQHGHEDAVELGLLVPSGRQKPVDLPDDTLLVSGPWEGVGTRDLDELGTGDAVGDESGLRQGGDIVSPVDDERGDVDRRRAPDGGP